MTDKYNLLPVRGTNAPFVGAAARGQARLFLNKELGIPYGVITALQKASLLALYHDTSLQPGDAAKATARAEVLRAEQGTAPPATPSVREDGEETPATPVAELESIAAEEPAEEPAAAAPVGDKRAILEALLNADGTDKVAREAADKALTTAREIGRLATEGLKLLDERVVKLAEEGGKIAGIDPDALKRLADLLGPTAGTAAKRLPVLAAAAKGDPIADTLARYYTPGVELVQPVLLTSPPSFGKSFSVRALAKAYDLFLEHGCCASPDEWEALIGGPVAAGEDGFVVIDGKITQAVRAASEGKNVLVLLDEVLRWPEKVQESLLTFLQPAHRADGTEVYRLTTRHKAGGVFEVLECETRHFHLVGAANLSFARPVEAFWSRWTIHRFDFTVAFAKSKAEEILRYNGVTDQVEAIAGRFADLLDKTRQGVFSRIYQFPADFRLLVAAVKLSDGTAKDIGNKVADLLPGKIAKWDAESAQTDSESAQEAGKLAEAFRRLFTV